MRVQGPGRQRESEVLERERLDEEQGWGLRRGRGLVVVVVLVACVGGCFGCDGAHC